MAIRKLKDIVQDFNATHGVYRLILLNEVRAYIKVHSWQQITDEINLITSESDIDVLIGAGMRGVLYVAALRRKAELMGI